MPHFCAVGLSLAGILVLTVAPAHAEQIIRWGHGWTSNSNPNNDMKTAGQREAHTVLPVRDMDVSQIAIRGGANRAGTPLYRIGIQGDDGTSNHYPNGQWLGGPGNFATSAIPLNAWQILTLPAMSQLTKGVRYHLVIEAAMADAANYSSIIVNYQPQRRCYRVLDGVYDDAVGRETYKGTSWSRASSMPIVGVDTNANLAIGQPWTSGENYTIVPTKDNRYGQTFKLDIPVESATVELLSLSLYVSTLNLAPNDDLRLHLVRAGSANPLLSTTLVDKNNMPAPGMITVATPPVRLRTGHDYLLVVESTNTITSAGYYRALAVIGPLATDFAQAAEASFQGSSGSCVVSTKNGAWTAKTINNGTTDLVFEMQLRVPKKGSVLLLR
jgi:hypothetical protein